MANTFKAGKGFKKTKPTFGINGAGRRGTPMAIKPPARGRTTTASLKSARGARVMGKKTPQKGIGKATVVRNGRPLATTKPKGVLNSFNMSKKAPSPTRAKRDSKSSSFFMSKPVSLRSATNSRQSASNTSKPRG